VYDGSPCAGQACRLRWSPRSPARARRWWFAALLDVADPGEQIGFDLAELLVRHLPHFALHFRLEQLLAQHGVVVQLGLGGRRDRPEHPAKEGSQHEVKTLK